MSGEVVMLLDFCPGAEVREIVSGVNLWGANVQSLCHGLRHNGQVRLSDCRVRLFV